MARVRTEAKRCEIIREAADRLEELGYDRCSMAMLAERVGGSKATLYGYFPSKDDLLRAVAQFQVATDADRILREFPARPDLRDSLIEVATAYLNKRTSSLPVANIRMVCAQPPGSTMGKDFYNQVIRPAWERLASKFEQLMDEGRLKRADPMQVMMHWKGLCDWDLFEKRIMGAIDGPDPKQIKKIATLAADAFLTLYGVEPDPKQKKTRKKDGRPQSAIRR
ncbi:MAG TPA: TetR/AcrR family transcriptional regulator [Sphingomicrobium sp.]|nr:TetR/AcrR family transcriptional regulator [Sphingomicrobium sp.]